jgi:hypothetical protein
MSNQEVPSRRSSRPVPRNAPPGNSLGVLTAVVVNFENIVVNSSVPALTMKLAGTMPGVQYDQLHASGPFSLGSILRFPRHQPAQFVEDRRLLAEQPQQLSVDRAWLVEHARKGRGPIVSCQRTSRRNRSLRNLSIR